MIFEKLLVFEDEEAGWGPWNMAMDEAIAERTTEPVLRVYRWLKPTVSFGVFEKVSDVRKLRPGLSLVRRWTGGGMVDHGEDWTYSLMIPRAHPFGSGLRKESYVEVHRALQQMLVKEGMADVEMGEGNAVDGEGCFARPVCGDLLIAGRKIAGAAQRRTRGFLLHQGSVQNLTKRRWSAVALAGEMTAHPIEFVADSDLKKRASEIVATKYGRQEWVEKL